jgi:hypothetical protein
MRSIIPIACALAFLTLAAGARAEGIIDLSKPMTGTARSVVHADGSPAKFGEPLADSEPDVHREGSGATAGGACGGSTYGSISCTTGRAKTRRVESYVRKNGTTVRAHYRSR